MPITQTIMWTALPNGVIPAGGGRGARLKLSVHISPRLETSASMGVLGDFPDLESETPLVNWAATLGAMQFDVEFQNGGKSSTRRTVRATRAGAYQAEPELWDAFFGPEMPIKKYEYKDYSKVPVNTFSNKNVFKLVKDQYAGTAALPRMLHRLPEVIQLVKLPGITNPPLIKILPTPILNSNRTVAAMSPAAAPIQSAAITQFEQFHNPWTVPSGFVAPSIPDMDFHKACTSLGSYPGLTRRLGLAIDLEVPMSSSLVGSTRVRIKPVWADGRPKRGHVISGPVGAIDHIDATHWTAVTLTTTAKTKKPTKFWPTSRDSEVKDGYLVARKFTGTKIDPTELHNIDLDNATSRLISTAIQISEMLDAKVNPPTVGSRRPAAAAAAGQPVSPDQVGLPALGQPTISLSVNGLANRVVKQAEVFRVMNDRLEAAQEGLNIQYAEDVNRGYRVDVWDDVTRQWHSLCRRIGTYTIGETPIVWGEDATFADEGWIQLSATSPPEAINSDEPPEEMRIHESVFEWTGWSLAVPRPGGALSEPDENQNTTVTKTFVGPDGVERPIGHYLHPTLPLDSRFVVEGGSLPRMRFGTTYRFRARTVDLAGNSIPFEKGSQTADPGGTSDRNTLVTKALTHKRYDPVKPPDVVTAEEAKPCESPYILVVRSYTNTKTNLPTTQNTLRHLTPPRIAVSTAEILGGLDTPGDPDKPVDPALWATLVERDAWEAPKDSQGRAMPQATIPSPVRYLPDWFSRGASLSDLPGVSQKVKTVSLGGGGATSGVKIPITGSKYETVATTRVPFTPVPGDPWYDKRPVDFSVSGVGPLDTRILGHDLPNSPEWDETQRSLAVELPKAEELTVGLSSYAFADDLKVMGVYHWGLEKHLPTLKFTYTPMIPKALLPAAAPTAAKVNAVPVKASAKLTQAANALINASLIGENWMLTPKVNLTLVHAVDKPMIAPDFTSRAHFERKPGETHATFVDWMPIHGKSTSKFELKSQWTENVDEPAKGVPLYGPTAVSKAAHSFTLTVDKDQERILNVGKPIVSMKSVPWGKIPNSGQLIETTSLDFKPQRQFFGDTKHRKVNLSAVETSRFVKYFEDLEDVVVTADSGEPIPFHVPSAARPIRPEVAYIIPTFGWTRAGTTSTRTGGGLRVYLERPWFSSGDDELLGVLLYQGTDFNKLSPFVTHWGRDPLYVSPGLPTQYPSINAFKKATRKATSLKIPEVSGHLVKVAGYSVDYDAETDMWFADIVIDQGKAYLPFVKLAFSRYQYYSLPGLELSPVRVSDFVQLTPDRYASVVATPGGSVNVTVTGQSYNANIANKRATVTATVERASSGTVSGWVPVTDEVELTRQPLTTLQIVLGITQTTWTGTVNYVAPSEGGQYRVVIREYEWFSAYGSTSPRKRLFYAEGIQITT